MFKFRAIPLGAHFKPSLPSRATTRPGYSDSALSRRAIGAGLLYTVFSTTVHAQTQSAAALMEAAYQTTHLASARFRARLTITSATGSTRARTLEGVSKTNEGGSAVARLVRVAAPADMRGVGTLTVERRNSPDDLWVYLPALRRVRRLVASNRRDAWLGSDFSYGDVAGHEVSEWRHAILRSERYRGDACTVVESTPIRNDIASETGYARRLTWLRDNDRFAVRAEFFDLSNSPLKTMEADQIRPLDHGANKSQAMRISITSARSTSLLTFDRFEFNVPVDNAEVAPAALTP